MAEQSCRKFPSTVSTTGAGDASLQANAKFAEIRRPARLHSQPLQPGTTPLIPTGIQGMPRRRTHRVASTLRGLIDAGVGDIPRLFWFV